MEGKNHIFPFATHSHTHILRERETLRALLCMWIYPLLHRLSLEWPHAVWEIDVHAHTLTYTHIQISLLLLVVVCVFHSTFHCIFPFYSFLFFFYKKSSSCVHLKEQSHAHRYRFFFEYDGILYTRLCSVWLFLFTSSSSFFVPCPNILFYFWAVGNWLTRKKKSERNTRSTSCFTIWGRKWKRNLARLLFFFFFFLFCLTKGRDHGISPNRLGCLFQSRTRDYRQSLRNLWLKQSWCAQQYITDLTDDESSQDEGWKTRGPSAVKAFSS